MEWLAGLQLHLGWMGGWHLRLLMIFTAEQTLCRCNNIISIWGLTLLTSDPLKVFLSQFLLLLLRCNRSVVCCAAGAALRFTSTHSSSWSHVCSAKYKNDLILETLSHDRRRSYTHIIQYTLSSSTRSARGEIPGGWCRGPRLYFLAVTHSTISVNPRFNRLGCHVYPTIPWLMMGWMDGITLSYYMLLYCVQKFLSRSDKDPVVSGETGLYQCIPARALINYTRTQWI